MTAKPYPEWTTNADGTRTTFGTFDAHGVFTPSETATTTLTETQLSVFQMNPGAGILSPEDAIRIQDGPNAVIPDAPAPVVQAPAPDATPTPTQPAPVAAIPEPAPTAPVPETAPAAEPPALVLTKEQHEQTRSLMQKIGDEVHHLSDEAKTAFAKLVALLHHV